MENLHILLAPRFSSQRCVRRLWVNRDGLTVGRSLPVYPDKQTYSESVGMSEKRGYGQSDSGLLRTNSQAAWASDEAIFLSRRSRPEIITR